MRKHFLLLFLLTLLPLATWAGSYDVTVTAQDVSRAYGVDKYNWTSGSKPAASADMISIGVTAYNFANNDDRDAVKAALAAKLTYRYADNVTISTAAANYTYALEPIDANELSVTLNLQGNSETFTISNYAANHGTLTIEKSTAAVNLSAGTLTAIENLVYNGGAQTLFSGAAAITLNGSDVDLSDEVLYSLDQNAADENWVSKDNIATLTGTNKGQYTLYYKINDNGSHNAQSGYFLTKGVIAAATPEVNGIAFATGPMTYAIENNAAKVWSLVAEGATTTFGAIKYRLGTDGEWGDAASITASKAGTYHVYYKVDADAEHGNWVAVDPTEIDANGITIAPATTVVNIAYVTGDLTYTVQSDQAVAQQLVADNPSTNFGTLEYRLKKGDTWLTDWTSELDNIKATNAGSYDVYYRVTTEGNWTEVAEKKIDENGKTIAKADPVVTVAAAQNLVYTGQGQNLIADGATTTATTTLKFKLASDADFADAIPTGTNAGTYTVYYKVEGNDNYNSTTGNDYVEVTIAQADRTIDASKITLGGAAVANYQYSETTKTYTLGYSDAWDTEATPVFQVKKDGAADWANYDPATYVFGKGSYSVKYSVAETANYKAVSDETVSFTVSEGTQDWATELAATSKPYDGTPATITAAVAAYENAAVAISYYTQDDPDNALAAAPVDKGNYIVKAVAAATENYASLEATVNYAITVGQATVAAPVAVAALEYNGGDQDLVTAGSVSTGDPIQYKVMNGDVVVADWATALPQATNAGTYTVSWKTVVNDNYETDDQTEGEFNVTINKKALIYALANQDAVYTGEEILPNGNYALMAGSFAPGEQLSDVASFTFGDHPTNVADSKTYKKLAVSFKGGVENYTISFSGSSELAIAPKTINDWVSDFTASANYDGAAKAATYTIADGLEENTDYTVTVSPAEVKNAGPYTYTFAPKGNYTGEDIVKTFTINAKAIDADMFTMLNEAEWPAQIPFDGENHNPAGTYQLEDAAIQVEEENYVLTAADYELSLTFNAEAVENPATAEVKNKGTYVFTFTGKGNYTGSFTKQIVIGAKTLDAADFTLAATTAVYTSADQLPAVTTALTADDYTLAITKDEAEVEEAINAGDYTFTFTGKGNYTGEIAKTFTITPAKLLVSVAADVQKNFDGNANFSANDMPTLEYSGLKGADTKAVVTENAGAIYAVDVEAAPGTYDLAVDVTKLAADNYTFEANAEITRTFTINATGLIISFLNNYDDEEEITAAYTKVYGADNAFNATWKTNNIFVGGAVAGDIAAIKNAITVTLNDENVGTRSLSIEVDEDANVFSNYDMTKLFTANGEFKITKATLTVGLKNDETREYNGEVTSSVEVPVAKLAVSGYKFNDDNTVITTLPTATVVDATKNVGTYVITLDGAEAANYNFEYTEARYVITPKKIAKGSVTIDEQTLQAGIAASNFDADAYSVENLVDGEDYAAIWGIQLADAHVDANDKIAGETDAQGIELYVIDEAAAANYEFDAEENLYGRLVIPSAQSIVLSRGDRCTQRIEAGEGNIFASDVENATIEFNSFAMDAKKWYAMVLPFDVTMMELINAFGGYVAVDVLDQTNTDNSRVYFELNGATIPAHTPFLIKLFAEKNLNTVKFEKDGGFTVEATASANTTVTDAAENEFIGTYAGKKFNGDNTNCWIVSLNSGKVQPASATATVYPLGAYIKTATANARFFVEENDGTVTEIERINADGSVVEAGAWYTVNGMKLDKAPVEKGVYVKDGKKVVIK